MQYKYMILNVSVVHIRNKKKNTKKKPELSWWRGMWEDVLSDLYWWWWWLQPCWDLSSASLLYFYFYSTLEPGLTGPGQAGGNKLHSKKWLILYYPLLCFISLLTEIKKKHFKNFMITFYHLTYILFGIQLYLEQKTPWTELVWLCIIKPDTAAPNYI